MSRINFVTRQIAYESAILAVYSRATAQQITDGLSWYPQAMRELEVYSDIWNVRERAAVCAILSPRITWASNLEGVKRIAKAIRQGWNVQPTVAGVRRNVSKAWDTAQDKDVTRVSGPKVSAFYANLCGDFNRVTIDVWAARAAGVSEVEMSHLDRNRYKCLERAYQNVAYELALNPAALQAIVWCVQRGHGEGTQQGTNQVRWTKG